MKATATPLLGVFEKKMRLEVPLFQRQYVWNKAQQWEPLWEDISRKFTEYIDGGKDAPVHFLGAMVLDQKQTPTTHVEKRQVIDGQQRLTTLQLFLAAFRDFCREAGCEDLAKECDGFTTNKGMMPDPEVDCFKIWPTQLDRSQFSDVMKAGSKSALEAKHPLVRRKYQRQDDPRPPMVEAYIYFHSELREFFVGVGGEPPLSSDTPISDRLGEAFNALRNALQVVVIDLEKDDDAQVIFETLNARGQPLLPADLLRNFIFLRAARMGEDQEALYEAYWKRFDDPFWREEVRQGRLARPRGDLFMQHFLASRKSKDIPVKHLYAEYKFWVERERPFSDITEELKTIARQGDDFRRILQTPKTDVLYPVAETIDVFDVRTAYPLLLFLLDRRLGNDAWRDVARILESYIVRRAVCGWTTKNYNRVFLSITGKLGSEGVSPDRLREILSEQRGESTEWPTDSAFAEAWLKNALYGEQIGAKVVHILRRLSDTYMSTFTERIQIQGQLTVEHIMPQRWREHWPLSDGRAGASLDELWNAPPGDVRIDATRRRDAVVHTIGNLTLVTQPLNSSLSNGPWSEKKPAILGASLLPLNLQLQSAANWDEAAIERRARELFARAVEVWPAPTRSS